MCVCLWHQDPQYLFQGNKDSYTVPFFCVMTPCILVGGLKRFGAIQNGYGNKFVNYDTLQFSVREHKSRSYKDRLYDIILTDVNEHGTYQ